eukprot:gene15875-biopygen3274
MEKLTARIPGPARLPDLFLYLEHHLAAMPSAERVAWYKRQIRLMLYVLESMSSKYSRKYMAKALPEDMKFLLTELLFMQQQGASSE